MGLPLVTDLKGGEILLLRLFLKREKIKYERTNQRHLWKNDL
jgi:hypothetical protein